MDLTKYFGNYRAKVLKNKDDMMFGRIFIWIPDIMPEIDPDNEPGSDIQTNGLWAYPANNPLGGRSGIENKDQWGQGSCYIPKIGSYVWVFFEGGNINRPYYFGSLDIETSKVLPENQAGSEYQNKWTIFKSSQGRCIVISDDCDERVEITGKKRKLKIDNSHPEGDIDSVYKIDGNQTTILLEETEGQEKLLIKTYLGDYINIDITNQELHCKFKNDIYFKSDADFYIDAKNIHINASDDMFLTAGKEMNIASTDPMYISSSDTLNLKGEENTMLYAGSNLSVVGDENLFLTGSDAIHQSTMLNLIGGDINVGLVVPRKASASPGASAGEAGEAGKPNPYGQRATNAECKNIAKPSTEPTPAVNPKAPSEVDTIDTIIPQPVVPEHDGSLIPAGTKPDDIFERII